MKIEPFILEQCYAHGIDTYPEEACGFISGPVSQEGLLLAVHRMTNVMDRFHALYPEKHPGTNHTGYVISPEEMIELDEQLTQQGHEIRAIYHTHVEIDAFFSEIDKDYAVYNGMPAYDVHYLVCSIKNRQPAGAILAVFNPETKDFDVEQVKVYLNP